MSIDRNRRVLLRAHLHSLRATAGPSASSGAFSGQLVLESPGAAPIVAWLCDHDHPTWGLAYACGLDEFDRLRRGE